MVTCASASLDDSFSLPPALCSPPPVLQSALVVEARRIKSTQESVAVLREQLEGSGGGRSAGRLPPRAGRRARPARSSCRGSWGPGRPPPASASEVYRRGQLRKGAGGGAAGGGGAAAGSGGVPQAEAPLPSELLQAFSSMHQ